MDARIPAVLEPEESGGFFVRFVDVKGAMTDGGTLDEARFNASEALSGILGWMLDENQPIPDPSPAGDGMVLAAHGRINHLFRPHRHRMAARDYRATRARAFDAWQQVTYARNDA